MKDYKNQLKSVAKYVKELEGQVAQLTSDNESAFETLQQYKKDALQLPEYKRLQRRNKELEREVKKWKACVLSDKPEVFTWNNDEEESTCYWGGFVIKQWLTDNDTWHWRVKRREDTVGIGNDQNRELSKRQAEAAAKRHASHVPAPPDTASMHLARAREQFLMAQLITNRNAGAQDKRIEHALEAIGELTNVIAALRHTDA